MTGIVAVSFEVFKYKHENKNKTKKERHEIFGSIAISDCNRLISLDFEASTKSRLAKMKKKLARLKEVIVCAEEFIKDNEHYINRK